jgi:hypothetical protein
MGVYRFRRKIGGRNAWYAVNHLGDIAEFRVVQDGESEKQLVAALVTRIYGARGPGPQLTLVRPRSASVSSSQATAIALVARAQRPAPRAGLPG